MTLLSKGIPLVFAGTLILGACEDGRRAQSSVSSSSRSITGSVTVHGSVTDGQGHPIVGATLAFLQSGTDAAIAQSAAGSDAGLDGTYSIEIGSGTYTVIVTPPSSSALQPLTLTNQQFDTSMRFDVVLVPEGSAVLRGHVLDQVGAPAAGASVSLNGYTTGLGYASATTDSSGFYQVVVLPGDYGLTLSDSFTSLSNPDAGTAGIDAGSSTSIYTSYGLGGYSVHVDGATTFDLTVPTPKILSGQVVDVDGTTPIAGASVMSSMAPTWSLLLPGAGHDGGTNPTFGNQNFSTTTDANGRFKLSLLPGSGQVQASIAGKPTAFASVTLVDDTEITIRFLSTAMVSGHALDQLGAPVAGASVSLNGNTTGLGYASATTDSSGFYQVAVLPGDYGLTLSDSFTSFSNPDAGTAGIDAGSSTSIYTSYSLGGYSVHVDGATTFDLTVPTPKILSGQVVDVDGTTPIAGASVMSSMAPTWSLFLPGAGHDGGTNPTFGNQNFSTATGADGRFKLSLLPGSGQVQASIAGKPTAFASVTLVDDTEITIRFLSTAMVSGHVLDQLGAPVAGASVSLNGNTTGLGYASATTDSSGFYQVAVLPGDYGLTLSDSFTSFSNPDAGTAGIDAGSSTSIYTSYSLGGYSVHVDGATTFDLTVPTPKTLSGQVVDVDGTTPIAGASVISSMMPTWSLLLPGAGHDGGTNPTFGNQNFSTATGADGRFKLSLLPGSGAITINPAQSPWLVPPTIPVNNFTEDTRIVIAVQFVSDSASAVVDPGESLTTDRSGTGATPTDPVATTVQIPPSGTSGAVVIDESLITQPPADPTAWVFLTQQVTIDAPPATADSPLVLTFLLDGSRLRPGEQASDIHMFRDGLQVLPCSNPASGIADPAPCVSEQGMSGDDVRFVVLTDHASNWNFGIAAAEVGGAGGANGAGAGGTSGGSGNGGASGSGTNGKGGVYGGGAGVVIIPTGSGGSPGGSPDGSVGGGQSTSSGGAGGTALNSAGSGGAGSTGTVGPPGAGLDASATEDGGQSAAVDGEVATAMDALTVRDAAGSTIDGPATASSGIDGAMAPSADTAAMVDAGLADAAPAAAIDGAGATLVDAVRSGGKPDGGIDASRAASSSAGGCGCDLAGHGRQLPSLWAAALAACAFLLARRRRR